MNCPGFQVIEYGIFDSRVAFPKIFISQQRRVNMFELELITETLTGIAYINSESYPLEKGLFLCGKPGQLRYSKLPTRCHYVHLQTEDPALLALLQGIPNACRLSDPSAIQQVFQELAAMSFPKDAAGALQIQSLVATLIVLASKQTAQELHTDADVRRSHRAMMIETENYIHTHLEESLTLEHLSQRVKFSPSHFHAIFTAWFGQTPHDFVLQCRIEAAKASLRSDRCSMIELASDCGFSSQSHFCAQFKKATGQTPLQYRKAKLSRLEP